MQLMIVGTLLLSVLGAVGAPAEPELRGEEVAFLCGLPTDFKAAPHVSNVPADRKAFAAAADRRKSIVWAPLPSAIDCDGKRRKLRDEPHFLDRLGFSPDGTLAAVSGGYVLGDLNGQGGECFFTRGDGRWSFLGCGGTWVS